ncbi:carbohydrate kinase family protein [Patescibacteria group bacterium]|nr:carbohydrate kinase family protein [Patescibacteria group bacterium]
MATRRKYDVVTIGSATRDAFFEGGFKIEPYPKTESGRAIILPFGEKFGVKRVYFTIGGNAANAGVTFRKQGFKTAVVAKVGRDVSGEEVRRRLEREGVSTSHITFSELPTAYSVLLLEGGERTILNYPGAANEFSIKEINFGSLDARWWYVSMPGKSFRSFPDVLRMAERKGIKVALNPTMAHITGARKELLKLIPRISFLVMNDSEASVLTGISFKKESTIFKRIEKIDRSIVAITAGPKGVTVSDGRFMYHAGIFKEKRLVDRTGAGDAFGSAFVSALLRKEHPNGRGYGQEDIEYAIRLASANSTATVEAMGATEGTLSKRQFDTELRFKKLNIRRKPI